MKMLNRQYVAPRVIVSALKGRFTARQLSKAELDRVLTALHETGINDVFNRLCDDTSRFVIDEILEQI